VGFGHGLSCELIGNTPCSQEQIEQGKKEAPTISKGRFKIRPVGAEKAGCAFVSDPAPYRLSGMQQFREKVIAIPQTRR
jgi:hypothetical protein